MNVQSETFKNWQVIKVSGQIDSKTVIKLRDFIDSELKADQPVALELTDVPFMSSAGLRTLLTLQSENKRTQSRSSSHRIKRGDCRYDESDRFLSVFHRLRDTQCNSWRR